jgi:hypothetical protein
MPQIMAPEKYVKVEHVKKREPGHTYISPDGGQRPSIFTPGWYYYSYRPIKYGPFPSEGAALNAGCEAAVKKRAKINDA